MSNMSKKFSLSGRTALITGGSRGLGFAFAKALAEAGANVAVFDIIPPVAAFHDIAPQQGVRTAHYIVDVKSLAALTAGFERFTADFNGALDICVPCAGIYRSLSFLDTDEATLDSITDINVKGAYFTAQLAAKQMIANHTPHGSIVFVASLASWIAVRTMDSTAYSASKGAVRAMVPAIAKELAKHRIRVNSISPGYVRTDMTAEFSEIMKVWEEGIMNGRLAEPEEIAGVCLFLAADASAYITGQDVLVDGGATKW